MLVLPGNTSRVVACHQLLTRKIETSEMYFFLSDVNYTDGVNEHNSLFHRLTFINTFTNLKSCYIINHKK